MGDRVHPDCLGNQLHGTVASLDEDENAEGRYDLDIVCGATDDPGTPLDLE